MRKGVNPIDVVQLVRKVEIAYDIIQDTLGDPCYRSKDDVLNDVHRTYSSGLVTVRADIPVGIRKAPDMYFRVEPRSRIISVVCTSNREMQGRLNNIIKVIPDA